MPSGSSIKSFGRGRARTGSGRRIADHRLPSPCKKWGEKSVHAHVPGWGVPGWGDLFMPRPTGDYSKMTPEDQAEYMAYRACASVYACGKATASVVVDERNHTEVLTKILLKSTEIVARFSLETYHRLMSEAGFSPEQASKYASRLRFDDETCGSE